MPDRECSPPPGFKGINVVNDAPVGGVPEPGGLPQNAASGWESGESILFEEISEWGNGHTRDDIAATYATALIYKAPVDWSKVNRAIVERWSYSALDYIKRRAWKLIQERTAHA